MKKLAVMAMAALMSTSALAQDQKHEISLGVGCLTSSQLWGEFIDALAHSFAGCSEKNTSFDGVFSLNYGYHITPRLVLGGAASFSYLHKDIIQNSTDTKVGDCKNFYISVMPTVKMNWANKPHFAFYSRAAVGLLVVDMNEKSLHHAGSSYSDDKQTAVGLAFQISPVGFEFGGKLRGYAEFGFGVDGIANAGLRYKF